MTPSVVGPEAEEPTATWHDFVPVEIEVLLIETVYPPAAPAPAPVLPDEAVKL